MSEEILIGPVCTVRLREIGKLDDYEKNRMALNTISWFFYGRQWLEYPMADLYVGMLTGEQIWLPQ